MATMFQQRHFEAIAEVFQDIRKHEGDEQTDFERGYAAAIAVCQEEIAHLFARENHLFDPQRFERACVPGANVKARTK